MTRLFLRFYAAIIVGFVITTVVVLGWLLHESPEDREVVERGLRGGMTLVQSSLRGLDDSARAPATERLSEQFGYGVRIRRRSQLTITDATRERLLKSDSPVYEGDKLFGALEGESVVVMGPLPDFEIGSGIGWVLLFVGLAWALVSLALLWPIFAASRELEKVATAMAEGDLSARIEPRQIALEQLARSFNSMAARTEMLVDGQRDLIAAASHEFRTPLARLRFASEMVGIERDESARDKLLVDIDRDVLELESLVAELLDYIRTGDLEQTASDSFDLRAVLEETVGLFDSGSLDLEWEDEVGGTATLIGERLFRRAVGNLLSNARRFASAKITIRTSRSADGGVALSVCDDGPGIEPADRARVLQPFVRLESAESGDGFGLGLAIVVGITERVGGRVELHESELGGTRVDLYWPTA